MSWRSLSTAHKTLPGKPSGLGRIWDLSGGNYWTSIGKPGARFEGIFQGNGHIIASLTIGTAFLPSNAYDNAGLFGYVGSSGKIKGLGVVDCAVYIDFSVGSADAGGQWRHGRYGKGRGFKRRSGGADSADDVVTLDQAVTILNKALNLEKNSARFDELAAFSDVPQGHWAFYDIIAAANR